MLEQITETIEKLRKTPGLGKKLVWDLKGRRSVSLDQFNIRIVYEIKRHPAITVNILSIEHRRIVYSDQKRYETSQKDASP